MNNEQQIIRNYTEKEYSVSMNKILIAFPISDNDYANSLQMKHLLNLLRDKPDLMFEVVTKDKLLINHENRERDIILIHAPINVLKDVYNYCKIQSFPEVIKTSNELEDFEF